MKVCKFTALVVCLLPALWLLSCGPGRQAKVNPPSPSPAPVPAEAPPASIPAPTPALPPTPQPPAPDPVLEQKAATDVLVAAEQRFQDGKSKLQAGDVKGAKTSFDAAVDLILSSGVDLRSNKRLKSIFDELFNQLYQLETVASPEAKEEETAKEKGKENPPEQKYEPAAADELENINVYPISIEPGLQHLVEEDIAHTKYDIPVHVNEDVLRWLEYYKGRGRNIMELGLKRIGLYRDMIHRIFHEAGVPKDLIYIAQQESMFKPLAFSRARAKGMWQFVYGTGKMYGLDQNNWVDEKFDPEKSTRAAAQHLLKLYDMFKDWYLVMAAYNSGEYGIQRITDKTGIRDFWQLAERKLLYKQTVDYVPSILATMIISKHPAKYGFDVQPFPAVQWKRVTIPSPVDLSVVAQAVGVTLDEIRMLNPELKRLVTPANQKSYEINLPIDKSEDAVKTLAALPVDKRVRGAQQHEIEEGESLWSLSRHYHVDIEAIMAANNMTSNRLRVGRTIIIPPPELYPRAGTKAPVSKDPPKSASAKPSKPSVTPQSAKATPPKGSIQLTVSSMANGHESASNGNGKSEKTATPLSTPGVPPANVAAKPATSGVSATATVNKSDPPPSNPAKPAERKVIHTVQPGDTLYDLARKYKTTTDQLLQWNGLKSNKLRPGDTLMIFIPR